LTRKKTGNAANPTVETQLKDMNQELKEIREQRDSLVKANTLLKRQLKEANDVIGTDLKADLIMRIKQKSEYDTAQLGDMKIEQLQAIDATLSMSKEPSGTHKPIRAGNASTGNKNLTIGSTYGKTAKEIAEME